MRVWMLGGVRIPLLVVFLIASALAIPFPSYDLEPQHSENGSWSFESVSQGHGGIQSISLDVDGLNIPHVSFYAPGEVVYALKEEAGWNESIADTTPFGGADLCLVVDGIGIPHVFYDSIALMHAWQNGSSWNVETVDQGAGSAERRICDAVVDSEDNLHLAWATYFGAHQGVVKYGYRNSSGWTVDKIDDGGIVSLWASVAIDEDDIPHLLYYGDVNEEVRYGSLEHGTWQIEKVESVGFIQYWGSHGSIAIDSSGNIHCVYLAFVKAEDNVATLKYTTKIGGLWNVQTIDGPPGMKGLFASMALDSLDSPHIASIDLNLIDPANDTFDEDLVYRSVSPEGWQNEIVIHGEGGGPRPWLSSLDMDSCNQPHVITYLNREIRYATKGPPCPSPHENRTIALDIDPDTLNLKSKGRWITAYLSAENASVNDIDVSTILLQDALAPERWDYQDDVLMLKFNRQDFKDTVQVGESVQVEITGRWEDGAVFEAYDLIRVINPGK